MQAPATCSCPASSPRSCHQARARKLRRARCAYSGRHHSSHQQAWPVPWIKPWVEWLAEPRFELWRRLFATLFIFLLLQAGNYIPVPGVLTSHVRVAVVGASGDLLYNSSPLPASLFMLSIGPTINASILLSVLLELPGRTFEQWREHMRHGIKGRETLKKMTRQIAALFAVCMALGSAWRMQQQPLLPLPARIARPFSLAQTAFFLVGGAWAVSCLGERVEPWGLGEGTALIICTSIASRYLETAGVRLQTILAASPPWWAVGCAAAGLLGLLAFSVAVSGAELRNPLNFWHKMSAAPMTGFEADRNAKLAEIARKARAPRPERAASSHYLPLPLVPGGISRLLFADFMFRIVLIFGEAVLGFVWRPLGRAVAALAAPGASRAAFPVFVFLSNLVDLRSKRLSTDYADYLYKAELNIVDVPPGVPTEAHLSRQQTQLRFLGSACLAAAAAAAQLLDSFCASFLGAPIGCTDILLVVSFIAAVRDQVRVLAQLPQLQRGLSRQQQMLSSLPQK